MKKLLFVSLFAVWSCASKDANEQAKTDVMLTEKAFALMAKEKGVAAAFYAFAAEDAVFKRGSSIIKGRDSIRLFYEKQPPTGELQWSPDFADVSGDLGYTYGKFTFTDTDSTGTKKEVHGIFHTVWKKQKDGTWKVVWD